MIAEDVMRPAPEVVHVGHTLKEALRRLKNSKEDCLIVVDGDEVVGHLTRRAAALMDSQSPGIGTEFVGNVMDAVMRKCRPDDELDDLIHIFRRSDANILAVVDRRAQLIGWVAREDVMSRKGNVNSPMSRPEVRPLAGEKPDRLTVYSEKPHVSD
ncbi:MULTISPECIES: CBS domain-containing protein [Kordiimonas]|jgi:Mg/Co/Ni transporter MgtE|uniref:CBS domain-containing protein n=1 Tax=Kordiimonas lacus TaxID=637679 RepID=A0A1G7ACS4_9PROT|nr:MULTISPECIES: CBS domain-containing protein [Kordiimonas]SDE11815.1 CBS domain-containing protein [Kordiimonas lacus]